MSFHLSKKSIIKKTFLVSMLTLLSRMLGVMREFLLVRYFGVGAVSDAFITAFKIPSFFRHIFAEGALSASFVPMMVKTVKEQNRDEANGLMTLSFLFFEGIVLLMYAFVLFKADWVVRLIAPGFSVEQIYYTVPFLQIMFSFLFFISSSALLAGALQAVNHFFVPAFGSPLWNIVFIGFIGASLWFKLPPTYLCIGVIAGSAAQFVMHLIVYFRLGFTFGAINAASKAAFKQVLSKFLPCLFGASIFELNLFISHSIASFLPKGSISLLYYGSRFMGIPQGMLGVALASILLPHFSRLVLYAPRRLNFYLLEVTKFVWWIVLPTMLFFMLVSKPLFEAMLHGKATEAQMVEGSIILMLYIVGIGFLCLNKILLSMLYALKDTHSTTIAAAISAAVNIVCDLVGMKLFGSYGIAGANSISALAMSVMCLYFLQTKHNVRFYLNHYLSFMARYAVQVTVFSALFWIMYTYCGSYIQGLFTHGWVYQLLAPYAATGWLGALISWLLYACSYWGVTLGLAGFCMALVFLTSRLFAVNVYFLRK
jgi:putative peptidoglycan lipid II flippase